MFPNGIGFSREMWDGCIKYSPTSLRFFKAHTKSCLRKNVQSLAKTTPKLMEIAKHCLSKLKFPKP